MAEAHFPHRWRALGLAKEGLCEWLLFPQNFRMATGEDHTYFCMVQGRERPSVAKGKLGQRSGEEAQCLALPRGPGMFAG